MKNRVVITTNQILWTIILLNTSSDDWYIDYINDKLNYQIKLNDLEENINILILDKIEDIQDSENLGEYLNIINNGDISDNYIKTIYNNLEKTKKNCLCFSGIYKSKDGDYVFNQKEENSEEIFIPINKMNPIKKEFILKKFNNYIEGEFKKISAKFIDDILVYIDSDIDLNKTINQETKEPFSIILTAYKTEKFIEECLDSIESQTYFENNDNYEILVGVDGCENTLNKLNEIKDKYRNLYVYMMKENRGTYMTTNALLNLIKYENVIRFDTDDIMDPNLVEDLVDFKNINDDDVIKLGYSDWREGKKINDYVLVNDGIIYFKKSVMDDIAGGYMPWECAADSELISRLKGRVKISGLNKRLFIRRIHDNSLTLRKDTGYKSVKRLKYNNQIKGKYNDDEVKIERVSSIVREDYLNMDSIVLNKYFNLDKERKYNLLFMISTYNRLRFLKKTINSWYSTCDKNHNWTLIIADDGSDDGTKEYIYDLNLKDIKVIIIENKRRGVHYQTNEMLKIAMNLDFDYGFKSDDDLVFKKENWDNKYIEASNITGYYHLIFYDKEWGEKRHEKRDSIIKERVLENNVETSKIQGALWTFNKEIILNVGFFDLDTYNLCGYGHVDYSLRCCRLGYNDINNPYDIINSNDYISLNKSDYFSFNDFKYIWNTPEIVKNKKLHLFDDKRIFFPFQVSNKNLYNKEIKNYELSFIVPFRGREDQILGLEHNLKKYFNKFSYEIIYVNQKDEKLFKRGQLCNIGFKYSSGEIIIFQDVDIRHLRELDFKKLLEEYKKPFVAFNKITQLNERRLGEYEYIETEDRPFGFGACSVFYKEQFIVSGGFSNLIFGWGSEDNIINERVGEFVRYQQDLGHVYHKPLRKDAKIFDSNWYKNNKKMLLSDKERDKYKDGYLQTDYDLESEEIIKNNIKKLNIKNINVTNFIYTELYMNCLQNEI